MCGRLGRHRLVCGDARNRTVFEAVMEDERADIVFTDPPYNVPIDGHATGLGRIRHREFAMGVGEMSVAAFTGFLQQTLGNAAALTRNGAIAFVCMDWRHKGELLKAGQAVFSELKNLCVWNKTNGGMGSFYRSKHELVFVFKVGNAGHTNTFGLGDGGRYRTNVWTIPGSIADGTMTSPCTRPSNRWRWWRRLSRIAPSGARSCSIPLRAPAPPWWRRRRPGGLPG
jgi:ketosteroid isomerase-like protein